MSAERVPAKVVRQLIARAEGCCERCRLSVVEVEAPEFDDRGLRWSVQHRKPAGMGGTSRPEFNSPANLLLLCGSGTTGCHGWVEANRTAARNAGWLVWQSQDPEEMPVLLHDGRRVLLMADWTYADTAVTP